MFASLLNKGKIVNVSEQPAALNVNNSINSGINAPGEIKKKRKREDNDAGVKSSSSDDSSDSDDDSDESVK